jgi:hypothetical protein
MTNKNNNNFIVSMKKHIHKGDLGVKGIRNNPYTFYPHIPPYVYNFQKRLGKNLVVILMKNIYIRRI